MKRSNFFLILFIVVSTIELLSLALDWQLGHGVAKTLIMLSLMGYYITLARRSSTTFVAALLFCWGGDVSLLFQGNGEIFFILGLVAFLIGHVLYIIAYRQFQSIDKRSELMPTQKIRFSLPIVLVGTGLIVILFPSLGGLKIPVLVYAMILMLMVMTALFRYGRTSRVSFWMVFAGAAVFMISDSLLAINKFYAPIYLGGLLVMVSYIAAQFLIVEGVLKHEADETNGNR